MHTKFKDKINSLKMGHLVNVQLAINETCTTLQRTLNCGPGSVRLNNLYQFNYATTCTLNICSIYNNFFARCTINSAEFSWNTCPFYHNSIKLSMTIPDELAAIPV